jgi:U4/U6.U5 tri-snRNP-associated protein 1
MEEEGNGEGEVKGGHEGGAMLELSIEETNKIRMELGLKPLDVGPPSGGQGTESNEGVTEKQEKKEDVHAPPENIGEVKSAQKLREKLDVMKETRELKRKLASVKGLADDDGVDDTEAWVEKMRQKEKDKKLAEERARLLQEMEEDYETEEPSTNERYSSQDLAGLTIEHKEDQFVKGTDVILTLKDSKVLEDQADVLVNVNMIDEEKGARNIELKKNQPGYVPYEETFDEYGNPISRSLLYKYDEEIEGVKVNKFTLDDRGIYNVGAIEREKEMSRNALEQKAISLELPQLNIPSEYYSSEEMVKFKKRKKMKKKKEKFKIADLVPLDNEDKGKDHGSRNRIKEGYTTTTTDEPMEISIDNVKDDPSLLDDKDTKVETALERLVVHLAII